MKKISNITQKKSAFKSFAIFSVSLFLMIMFVGAFFIVPKFNSLLDNQHEQQAQLDLTLEAALFSQFILSQKTIVQDLAAYPVLASAVMLGEVNDLGITELFDNSVIGGEKSRLVLQDISGAIVIKTDNRLYGNYINNLFWLEQLLNGDIAYHFQLLRQNNAALTFKVSVPVFYNRYIEGVLSSEITVPLKDIFVSQNFNKNAAFKLSQGSVAINTGTEHIKIHRENSLIIAGTDIVFTYITDDSLIYNGKRELQNTILYVLLFSFTVSFLLFGWLNYQKLTQSEGRYKVKLGSWQAYVIPIIVGVIGLGASISGFMIASNLKYAVLEKELIFESKQKIEKFSKEIAVNLQMLDSVKAFYNASDFVSRQEFSTFVTPLLVNYQNINAIQWLPLITNQHLKEYQQKAIADGIDTFIFQEKDINEELIPVTARESYFPNYYVEPMLGNEHLLGLDLSTKQYYISTLNKAKNSGDKVATAKVLLNNESGKQIGVYVFNPVYQKSTLNNNENSQTKLLGFIKLTLNIEAIVAEILNTENSNLLLYIEDITEPENVETIYGVTLQKSTFFREQVLDVAGRSWRILTYSKNVQNPLILSAWLVLIAGLTVSSLITFGVINLIRRREIVEQLVQSRTEALKRSEEEHRAVVENAVDGLLTIDEFGIIEKYNGAAEGIFGYSADEVIGQNFKILIPASDHEYQEIYMGEYRGSGVKKIISPESQFRGRRKNGEIFPIDLSISEIKIGNTRKLTGIVRDVTQRVMLEKEREKFIEKLTDSNEELARFAYVCSHDLQEPLRMVRSFSELLQGHLKDTLENDTKGQKYFSFVIDGAARAQMLISDILSYSSINSDTQMSEKVDIESMVLQIEKDLLDPATGKNGQITFDPLPVLQGNKTQLFQLLQNLISNGLKYQQLDATPHVHIGLQASDTHWHFMFKDNGIGMEERHLKKIFEVFQRLHGKKQYAGTGVGLAICKKVVERHDGVIWVESEVNIGSTFNVKLKKPTDLEVTQ